MNQPAEVLAVFSQAPYVSLRTYRKSGIAVDTAIWCASAGEHLYGFSAGQAGKVKRIRNSSHSALAVCDVRGKVLGPWSDTQACVLEDENDTATALAALRDKYGWQMAIADIGAKLSGKFSKRAYLRMTIV